MFFFTDCAIIAKVGGALKIFEVGTTATLKWNLNGVLDGTTIYQISYSRNGSEFRLLTDTPDKASLDISMNYVTENNPIDKNRISSNLKLIDGNGTLTVTLSNIQYNESGVFKLQFTPINDFTNKASVNSTLDVRGK